MLVLGRKLGEKIVIGDNIVITVVKIDGNSVRLGMEGPQDVPIYREEICPEIYREDISSSSRPGGRPRNKFTDWSIRYHAAEPNAEHVRLGVAELHAAFPGSTITIESAGLDGDVLNITPPAGTSVEDIDLIKIQAQRILGRIQSRYLPYHGWTIRYQTSQPQASTVQRRLYALRQRFPGAEVRVESSDSSRDRLAIEHAKGADSDAKLSAFETAKEAMKEATLARINELRHADPTLLKLMFREALTPPGARRRQPATDGFGPDDDLR